MVSIEGGLLLISGLDSHIVKPLVDIQLGEVLGSI